MTPPYNWTSFFTPKDSSGFSSSTLFNTLPFSISQNPLTSKGFSLFNNTEPFNSNGSMNALLSIFANGSSGFTMPYTTVSQAVIGADNFSGNLWQNVSQMLAAIFTLAPQTPDWTKVGQNEEENKVEDKKNNKDTETETEYKGKTNYFNYSLKKTKALENKGLSDEFLQKTVDIAKEIGCDPVDLLAVMNSESGIKASQPNKAGSGAMGLIQFMPETAKYLGTSTEELAKMSPEKQLDYVKMYLTNRKSAAGFKKDDKIDGATLYALIYYPKNAKKDIVTSTENGRAYSANIVFDKNKDGKITKSELAQFVDTHRKALGYEPVYS